MNRYHIVFSDPFINYHLFTDYISERTGMKSIPVGHLFGKLLYENSDIKKQIDSEEISYFSVFEKIVLDNLDSEGVIIPAYPRSLDTKPEFETLKASLKLKEFELERIWYIQNSNLAGTVIESLTMKGKATSGTLFESSLENAISNQQKEKELVASIGFENTVTVYNNKMMTLSDEAIEKMQESI